MLPGRGTPPTEGNFRRLDRVFDSDDEWCPRIVNQDAVCLINHGHVVTSLYALLVLCGKEPVRLDARRHPITQEIKTELRSSAVSNIAGVLLLSFVW